MEFFFLHYLINYLESKLIFLFLQKKKSLALTAKLELRLLWYNKNNLHSHGFLQAKVVEALPNIN